MNEDTVVSFGVHLDMDEWAALLQVLEDHCNSLDDWDAPTRAFYNHIYRVVSASVHNSQ